MKTPGMPSNESSRLQELHEYGILDTGADPAFDALTRIAAYILDVPVALVSLVDADRQWFKSRFGTTDTETPRDISFCGHVVGDDVPLVVEDASADERFSDNPLVAGDAGIRFYAGFPLRTENGFVLGTLCTIDRRPRKPNPEQIEMLELLAGQAMDQIEKHRKNILLQTGQSELRKALDAVERNAGHMKTLLDKVHVGAVLVNESGLVDFINLKAQSLLDIDPSAARSRPWIEVLPGSANQNKPVISAMKQKDSSRPRIQYPYTPAGGAARHLEFEIFDDPRNHNQKIIFIHDRTELVDLRTATNRLSTGRMVGTGRAMADVFRKIREIATGDWTTLIEGETGTGKELVARAIHAASRRSQGRFIALNCGGLTESLLASQLFGHRRGAFTGAVADQEGVFEAADGGTLLLDEIGEIPLSVQAHLLRVLQEREIVRVGETRPRKVDVRILAATNRSLDVEAEAGRFRKDLLYRVKVARIDVPPLRERPEDIPLLVETFLTEARPSSGKAVRGVSDPAMSALAGHDWPGNIRELRSAVDYAIIHCVGDVIEIGDLPPELNRNAKPAARRPENLNDVAAAVLVDERKALLDALRRAHGNRSDAARLMGISRATFYRKLRSCGITRRPDKSHE